MRSLALVALVFGGCIESQENNPFGEGLLQGEPAFLHGGEAWPVVTTDDWLQPEPDRIFYVAQGGDDSAFGGSDEPWADLQTSLCKLRAGDRLVVRSGSYQGPFFIDDDCPNVNPGRFIEVVGEPGAKIVGGPSPSARGFWKPVLTINRAGWTVRGFQIDGSPSAGVPVQVLAGGQRTILRDLVLIGAGSAGLTIGPLATEVSARNLVIRNGVGTDTGVSHGVVILGGCRQVNLTANFIHHNSGDGIHILGGHIVPSELGIVQGMSAAEGLVIEGNKIHANQGHGVVVGHSVGTHVKANTIWNVRPSTVGEGIAIEVHDGAQDAAIERNLVVEATEGVSIGAGERPEALAEGARAPQSILVERNMISNPLSPSRHGISVDTAVSVRIYHNAVHRSRRALMISDLPPKTQSLRVLNNLFLEAVELGFRTSGMAVFDRFEFNAFGLGGSAVQSEVGEARQSITSQVEAGTISETFVVGAASFTDDNLDQPNGVQVVDKGTSIPGFGFEGTAPDLGPVEHVAAN
jgi:hypothetical protein